MLSQQLILKKVIVIPTSTDSTPSTPVPIEGQPTENLNLRDQPSTSGKILTTIPKGKTVTILSEKNANGWYKVSYNGKTGYVSGIFNILR